MAKMYLEENNGGRCLLVTDENGRWYCFNPDSNDVIGDGVELNRYDEHGEPVSVEEIAADIGRAIRAGKLYSPEEFIKEYGCKESEYDHRIPKYDGMTIDDIDRTNNYKEDPYSGDLLPLGHDTLSWTEIKKYRAELRSSEWENGSGWLIREQYVGVDDLETYNPDDAAWDREDFISYLLDVNEFNVFGGMEKDEIKAIAENDSGFDTMYTWTAYEIGDEGDNKIIETHEVWESELANRYLESGAE